MTMYLIAAAVLVLSAVIGVLAVRLILHTIRDDE